MRNHAYYDHKRGHRKQMSFGKKLWLTIVFVTLTFMAAIVADNIYTTLSAKLPDEITYQEAVDKKNECFRYGYEATVWQNGHTLETIGITCNETKLR